MNGVDELRDREVLVHAGVAAVLTAGVVVAGAGPAHALPRSCARSYEEYDGDIGLASMYLGLYNTRHYDTLMTLCRYWTGQADGVSAMFVFC
jgi:hypothetical protein